jgi:uncharacterized protein with PhoU and TrkA domain
MLRDKEANIRFAEVAVTAKGMAGKTLGEAAIHERIGIPVLAVRSLGEDYVFTPDDTYKLQAGDVVVVMGARAKVEALEKMA